MSRTAGFSIDSLQNSRPGEFDVETPDQTEDMFDVLTYEKGSTVLRMFQMIIGEQAFLNGVESYLNQLIFDNTNSSDLWDSLTEASNLPLNEILPFWIREKCYPLLHVDCSNNSGTIRQRAFLLRR
jgi:Aminopeptidase N